MAGLGNLRRRAIAPRAPTREMVATIAVPIAYPAKMSNIAIPRLAYNDGTLREFLPAFCAGRHIQRKKKAPTERQCSGKARCSSISIAALSMRPAP